MVYFENVGILGKLSERQRRSPREARGEPGSWL